jgi:hypothetical protein
MSGWGKGGRARRSAPHTAAHAHAGGPRVSAAAQVHSPRCPQLPLLLSLIVWGNARRLPELGNQIAPYFAVAQIIFLLMFVAYFTLGVVALIHDHEAMDCECAEDSWIWLYALLVVVIPTSLGTMRAWAGWMRLRMAYTNIIITGVVIGFIKGAMAAADLDEKLGFDTSIFTTLPGPALFLTLGALNDLNPKPYTLSPKT